MKIQHLRHNEIDTEKWEKTILNSVNGNIYAFSWYLNIVSENWEALVLDDYEAVMPLPTKNVFGFNILRQPLFTQQLGVFSPHIQLVNNIQPFTEYIHSHFRYISLQFNKHNALPLNELQGIVIKKNNFELDLIPSYNYLWGKYHSNTKRNILKARQNQITVKTNSINAETFTTFIKKYVGLKVPHLSDKEYQKIKQIVEFSLRYKFGELYSAYDEKNRIIATVLFTFTHQRAYYLFAASSPIGKEKRAMFLLIDEFIKKYAEKNVILDFEGSMIPGLARFYESYGATNCNYEYYHYNKLPLFLKIIKH